MDKLEQLFIRACKSESPRLRVKKLYCKHYYNSGDNPLDLCRVLVEICDKHKLFTATDLVCDLAPGNAWKTGCDGAPYWDRVLYVLISKIRLTEVSKLPGLSIPAKFKRPDNGH